MKILGAIIIILVVAIVGVGGFYAYTKYVPKSQTEIKSDSNQVAVNGPKTVYIEYLNKTLAAKTLEEAMDITMEYGYATPADKTATRARATIELAKMSVADKAEQLDLMQSMMKEFLKGAPDMVETISGNSATLESTNSEGWTSSVDMIKDGGVWKITQ